MMECGMVKSEVRIQVPEWLQVLMAEKRTAFETGESRMHFVIELARLNIENGTGGPFGAAIFDMESHRIIAAGVNLVVGSNCSMAHAEMVAIALAQHQLGTYDLGASGLAHYELVSSCEPCAMCFGALPWSGIRHLACGARDEDARAIGFDEGPKMPTWRQELEKRGITVTTDLCRDEARKILNGYAASGGEIYNARQGEN